MNKVNESPEAIQSVLNEVSELVSKLTGIQLGEKQRPMVENRLKTRMVRLGHSSFQDYLRYLKAHLESESQALLSLMTTHHTYFFREFTQFEHLLNHGLNSMIEEARLRPDKKIKIWSAACSRGQEVYSLAMFFDFHLKAAAPDVSFEIIGTDVDPESVEISKNGVYKNEELKKSPAMYLGSHWVQGTGNVKNFSKAKDSIKSKCRFEVLNLLKAEQFLANKKFDLIFCRNVFIYFNADQIKTCSQNFFKHLDPKGFLFLGVSESLNGLGMTYENAGPSIYRLPQPKVVSMVGKIAPKKVIPLPEVKKGPFQVLCIDDSSTILALMKKILTSDAGFQVKATAMNGLLGLEELKKSKFDIITLDLHMPEMDGLSFLQALKDIPDAPPVMVVSSVNREDVSIAQKALSFGAKDYVQKPSLENLVQGGEEIRSKLKTILSLIQATAASRPVSAAAPSSREESVPLKATGSFGAAPRATTNLTKVTDLKKKVKVLIVDDSSTIRQLLKKVLSSDNDFEIVGEAEKPSQVEALIKANKPDVITLDIHMPEMNGVELLKIIQPKYKIPTLMISSISREEGTYVLDALEVGAFDYIQKPQAKDMNVVGQQIRERLKAAAESKSNILGRLQKRKAKQFGQVSHQTMILMGASTGGTEALRHVLESLPSQIPPIMIVQHIPAVFSAAFADRLNSLCPFAVKEAKDGDEVKSNQVLIAPGGTQMGFKVVGQKVFVKVTDDAPMNRHKPSVDYMFQSAAQSGFANSVAVILTGMGADGAQQMKVLRNMGVRTIGQDQASCVVYGMPRMAYEAGAVEFVKPLNEIAETIVKLVDEQNKKKESQTKAS